ncbi:hypothetical protein SUGI_0781360 [Cryptomeria japonica]|nr:hypothetical protein SUGI_0781360 [Cryptomeria japonica]
MESIGLDKETLDALPIAEYKSQNMNEDLECVVCLSKFEENEKIRVIPNCNHSFHAECINMWLHSHTSCPICRETVPSNRPPSIISSSRRRESTSSSIDTRSESVVHCHLVRGQRSSSAMQHPNQENELMLAHHGTYVGRPVIHTAIHIGPY